MPPAAYAYAGPYAGLERDIRRFDFHGINVAYRAERASRLLRREAGALRLAVAHLGGGCSLSAVRDGASIDTSMGFTPLDGVPMGTRSGSIDPDIAIYLLRQAKANETAAEAANEFDDTLDKRSGLAGLSGLSGDVRELQAAREAGNERAALALEVFEYRLAAAIASFLPALGRVDALGFSGGIGEHAAATRARVCERLRRTTATPMSRRRRPPCGCWSSPRAKNGLSRAIASASSKASAGHRSDGRCVAMTAGDVTVDRPIENYRADRR